MTFARTKIQPPRPRGRVLLSRPRVDGPLRDALATQRLVLVSAPAGYGKSALMAQQLQDWPSGVALAWVSVDADDDLPRLLECLVAALEPYDLPWRSAPEALVAGAGDANGRARFTAELLNALEATDVSHGVIVIDDLHRTRDEDVHRFLESLVDRLGPRWTVAILTRHDPPLALARWRAAGELAEFSQDALRWTRDELAAWLAAAGAAPERLDALLARTEGWAAGVQLALRVGRGGASIGSERAFNDFLTEEVIDTLDAELRDFLLQACVLPELTAVRAAAVTGRADAARLLERVEALGLFVTPLEAPEPTLRLHDLFRAALEQRLRLERPDALPQLLRRAAAGETDPVRCITLLLRSGDAAAAAQVLLAATPAWITAGALPTARAMLALFDAASRERLAAWHLSQCLLGWAQGDFATMDASARAAEALGRSAGDTEVADMGLGYRAIALNFLSRRGLRELGVEHLQARAPAPHVVSGVALAWAHIDEGRFDEARQCYAATLQHLERSTEPHLWYQGNLGTVGVHIPGMGPLIERWIDGALRVSGEQPLTLKAMALMTRGWHRLLVNGDIAGARDALEATQQELRWLAEPTGVNALASVLQLQIAAASGDAAATREAMQQLLHGPSTGQGHRARWIIANFIAGCAAAVGDAEALREQLAVLEYTPVDSALPGLHAIVIDIARGHVAWLRGDDEAAISAWQRAVADETGLIRTRLDAPTRLFLAAACARAGRLREAAAPLVGWHARARLGAAGSALFARPVAALLAAQAWRGQLDEADRGELERWLHRLATVAVPSQPTPPTQPTPPDAGTTAGGSVGVLSSRELEVLERVAAGDSNKLIARALVVSPHTVKRHVANILDKLALASRGRAAAWYRANV
ncbi:LuxR C-terminal-related transcriptional regulator [Aquabacterium sp.]|uniref:LuxR C-terminal-related transcriptional regulator n=1 Tax=Aquabacterium sp. TaxID=1872578 RepID=UPI002C1C560D|nr:LuxR C-terminal-related transcriptional regulator [Aquabacterium sp.]HSW03043.1 LuxR C-terminal-related transcriptional regulator [Aquabacterium sp.]